MTGIRRSLLPLALLVVIIAAGAYLRIAHLAAYDLTQDELSLYYTGHALAEGRPPELPSGRWYGRGTEYARLAELAQRHITTPETAVRLPSAVLGALSVALLGAGTWIVAGAWPAVGAALLLAVHPDAIIQSRTGRFYMLQLVAGLLALFGGWLVIRHRHRLSKAGQAAGVITVTLIWLFAIRVQVTALPMLVAWWLALAVAGVWDVRRRSIRWQESIPYLFAVATLIGLALLLIIDPGLVGRVTVRALSMPMWARVHGPSQFFYLRQWSTAYSVLAIAAPLAFLYLLLRRRGLGAYLAIMFAVPTLVCSLLLPFKADRFVQLALPPMFIATGICAAALGRALFAGTSALLERRGHGAHTRSVVAGVVVAVGALAAVASMGAARTATRGYWSRIEPGWHASADIVNARPDLSGIPIGASKSLPPLFYWGRIDFNVGRNFLEQWSFDRLTDAGVVSGRVGAYRMQPIGTPDLYAGVPVLTTPQSIRDRFAAAGAVLIAVDGQALYYSTVDTALLQTLNREAEELCRLRCGSLWLYLWRFR